MRTSYQTTIDRRGGWSLVELSVATSITLLGLLGVISTFFLSMRAEQQRFARADTSLAMRNVMATIKAQPFEQVVSLFGPGSTRDIFYCGGEGEISFDPQKITRVVAQIEFFLDESKIPAEFGCLAGRWDLDGNGVIDVRATQPKLLPLCITLKHSSALSGQAEKSWFLLGPSRAR